MRSLFSVCLFVIVIGSGCSSDDSDCSVGSEGCKCTPGGSCDPGLVCFSKICVDPGKVDAKVPTDGPAGTDGPSGSDGPATDGNAPPPDGKPAKETGPTPDVGPKPDKGPVPDTAPKPDTTKPATCPFPQATAQAKVKLDLSGSSKALLALAFSGGKLTKMDGLTCAPDTSGTKATKDWGTYPCIDAYKCGSCLVFLLQTQNTPQSTTGWLLLGAEVATYGTVKDCPQYGASYTVCYPTCP